MKKVVILAAAAALIMGLTACANTTDTNSKETVSAASMAETEADDSLEGLCKYLAGNGIVTGSPREMLADIIGAKAGYKYSFNFNDAVVDVELYEFDLNALKQDPTGTGAQVVEQVKNEGNLPIMGNEVKAFLSNNGKYLMIYTDRSDKEDHVAQAQKAESLFKGFKANATSTTSTASSAVSSTPSSTPESQEPPASVGSEAEPTLPSTGSNADASQSSAASAQ